MHKTRFNVLCLVIALLALANSASATLYLNSGQYRFNVRVSNSSFKDISNARGRVFVSGNSARIDVEAPGYRTGYQYVYLRDNVTNYSANVRLDDPTIWINLIGSNHKPIADASTSHYSQSMYWGDEFGFTGQFSKKGFEKLTARDFTVRINSMYAFGPRVYLTSSGDNWRFEIIVKRRDMNSMFSNRFEVVVKCDPDETAPTFASLLELAKDYTDNVEMATRARSEDEIALLQCRLESNATRLIGSFVALAVDEQSQLLQVLPADSALVRQLKGISAFNNMHQ